MAARQPRGTPSWVGPILDQARDGVAVFDAGGALIYVNRTLTDLLGYDPEVELVTSVLDLVHPDDLGRAGANLAGVADGVTPLPGLIRLRHGADGWARLEVSPFRVDLPGPPEGPGVVTAVFVRDPSLNDAHWRFLTSLSSGEPFDVSVARLAEGLSTAVDGPLAITFVDGERPRHVGPVPPLLVGLTAVGGWDETPGTPWVRAVEQDASVTARVEDLPAPVRVAAEDVGAAACVVVPVTDPAGGPPALLLQWPPRWAMAEILREALRRRPRHAVALALDRRDAQQRLEHLAHHDALSGLANRGRFFALASEQAASGRPYGVCYVDLDDFKPVNDTLGHVAGDRVLEVLAGRLRAAVERTAGPGAVIARLGGDEFAVAVDGADPALLEALAAAIVEAMAAPLAVGGIPIQVGASVGCAHSSGGDPSDAVIAAADTALYDAKHAGRGTWRWAPGPSGPPGPDVDAAPRRTRRPAPAPPEAPRSTERRVTAGPQPLDARVRTLWHLGWALVTVPVVALAVAVGAVASSRGAGWVVVAAALVAVGMVVATAVVPRLQHRRWRWELTAEGIELSHGVVVRVESVIPAFRVQQIDVRQGPLERWLGLARLQVTTASSGSDGTLPGLAAAEAEEVRRELLARVAADDGV